MSEIDRRLIATYRTELNTYISAERKEEILQILFAYILEVESRLDAAINIIEAYSVDADRNPLSRERVEALVELEYKLHKQAHENQISSDHKETK